MFKRSETALKCLNIESNNANLTPSKKSAVTNSMGQIDFDLSGSREGTYYVFLSCDGFEVKLFDTTVAIDAPAMIKDNRTFVPVRALMEAFGATVDFDAATNKVSIKADGKTIELTLGSSVMTVGDQAVTMDVAAFATNEGRTMVPVRAIAEAAGYTVEATSNADGTTASVVFTK